MNFVIYQPLEEPNKTFEEEIELQEMNIMHKEEGKVSSNQV